MDIADRKEMRIFSGRHNLELAEEVADDSYAQELEEEWAIERVAAGESSIGTFPIAKDRRAEFEEWLAKRQG